MRMKNQSFYTDVTEYMCPSLLCTAAGHIHSRTFIAVVVTVRGQRVTRSSSARRKAPLPVASSTAFIASASVVQPQNLER
jgi:hypothetical protein